MQNLLFVYVLLKISPHFSPVPTKIHGILNYGIIADRKLFECFFE